MNIGYYNHEFKMELINSEKKPTTINKYKNLFKKSKAIETKYNKDIYELEQHEMQDILNIPELVVSKGTFNNVRRLLVNYFDYAISHNKSVNQGTVNMIQKLDYDNMDISYSVRAKFFRNYVSMLKVFDSLMCSSDVQQDTEDNFIIERMCCITGLMWFGLEPADIMELTVQDINKDKGTVFLSRSKKRISLPAILIDQCLALQQYVSIKRAIGMGVGTFYFTNDDKIIKIKKNNRDDEPGDALQHMHENFMFIFHKRLEMLPVELQETYKKYTFLYRDIARNGRFEKYYNKEQQGGRFVPTFEDYMVTFNLTRPTAFNEFKTYQKWKEAYNLK